MQTDEQLFASYTESNDAEVFGQLYDRHHAGLLVHLRRYFGDDQAAAEDAIQQAFQRAYEYRDQFQPGAKFAAWLYSIAGNCAIDAKRYAARQQHNTCSFDSARKPQVPRQSISRDDHSQLRAVLATLDAQDSRLVEMVYFDGANYAEASAAMGWSVNDTRVRLSLALKQIKGSLELTV